jgi:hypothetical protein
MLTMKVGYYMPPATAPATSFFLTVTGTSSNNVTGRVPRRTHL